jgi:peptidoglycan/LPS O-acetylase OafA/YrhL
MQHSLSGCQEGFALTGSCSATTRDVSHLGKNVTALTAPKSRVFQLDGLRGLAALSVFFSHVAGLVPNFDKSVLSHSILHVFWDGASAVTLFFVLSGYVLSLPFTGSVPKRLDLAGFLLRRVTRLYPAYWFALVVAIGLRYVVLRHNNLPEISFWAGSLWTVPINLGTLIKHFFMIVPGIDTTAIDPVIWSLVAEMKISLIFPAIVLVVQRTSRPVYALLILAGLVTGGVFLGVLGTTTLFVAGSYLAKYRLSIIRWASRLSGKASVSLLAVAFVLYGNVSIAGEWGRGSRFVCGFGALLLILLALTFKPLSRLTTIPPSHFLGEISYSFYLLHLPILLAVSSALYPRCHSVLICATVALAISFGMSKLVFKYIEWPMQRFGKQQAQRVSKEFDGSKVPVTATAVQ